MTDDTDWIPDFIKATLERGARRLRGEDPGPTVMYTEVDGRMQRVDDGADLDRRRERMMAAFADVQKAIEGLPLGNVFSIAATLVWGVVTHASDPHGALDAFTKRIAADLDENGKCDCGATTWEIETH